MAISSTTPTSRSNSHSTLNSCFKPSRSWQPFHSGGQAAISAGADVLFSTLDSQIIISHILTGSILHSIDGDSSPVSSICSTTAPPSAQPTTLFLIAYRSLSIRIYALHQTLHPDSPGRLDLLNSTTNAHAAPISVSRADPSASLFATGDASGVVRLWDARAGHCTHVFKGHSALVSALAFDIDLANRRTRLAVGSADARIRLWDLATHQLVGVFEGAHVSIVRGLDITPDGRTMVSGSRDKVLNVWSLAQSDKPGQILKTIPVYETIEAIGLISVSPEPDSIAKQKTQAGLNHSSAQQASLMVYTAGDKGLVRLWNLDSGLLVATEQDGLADGTDAIRVAISDARLDPVTNTLLVNKIDNTFSLLKMPELRLVRQIVGSHDEIIDLSLLKSSASAARASHLAVATNSPHVRVLSLGLGENDCRLLAGHRDIVLCLATSRDQRWIVTGSKDTTARIWTMGGPGEPEGQAGWRCAAICEGHVQSVGALSVAEFVGPNGRPTCLLATASQDRTVKLWDVSSLEAAEACGERGAPARLASVLTLKIHDKDINATDFSGDCTLFASGSQDRLAKVFSVEHSGASGTALKLVGVLKGHQRGIWTVKFSPDDTLVATGSGDCTVKLWATDRRGRGDGFGSCVKTLEGHSNAVLRLAFIGAGTQVVSSSSDGLVKVWEVKTQVCVSTLGDEEDAEPLIGGLGAQRGAEGVVHDGKVWALEVEERDGTRLVTGGGDGKIICWEDVSALVEAGHERRKEAQTQLNQEVENYIRLGEFGAVVGLLIELDEPARLLRLLSELGGGEHAEQCGEEDWAAATGSAAVDGVIGALAGAQTVRLLGYVRGWNAVTKTAEVAQRVLNAIVKSRSWEWIIRSYTDQESGRLLVEEDSQTGPKGTKFSSSKGELKKLIDGILPYTERQLNRIQKFTQEGFVVEYLVGQMNR